MSSNAINEVSDTKHKTHPQQESITPPDFSLTRVIKKVAEIHDN